MKKFNGLKRIIFILCVIMAAGMMGGCSEAVSENKNVRIGALKGPTSMGLMFLMEENKKNEVYTFTMATQADELLGQMAREELDIALIPANVAAVLYQKMDGKAVVIDINTLGVLYMVTGDDSVATISDLKGRTIYLTGKGTTPDYVFHYILEGNGLSEEDLTLEYRSEATEVAAILAKEPEAVGLLPQPFVTAACFHNEALQVVLDLNAEWNKLQKEDKGCMVTGVTVVRKAFLEENKDMVDAFLKAHEQSVGKMKENPQKGAELVVEAGIVASVTIAMEAIPKCNIACIVGEEMRETLSGYLMVLCEQNPEAVGGSLPAEDFYYEP